MGSVLVLAVFVAGGAYFWQEAKIVKLTQEKNAVESEKVAVQADRTAIQGKLAECTALNNEQQGAPDSNASAIQQNQGEVAVRIKPENAISWTSGNDAKVNLVGVGLEKAGETQQLNLYFDVSTKSGGGYCWQSMEMYLRVTNGNGEYVNPQKVDEACIDGFSVMKERKVSFIVPADQKTIDVYNRGRDAHGDVAMKKVFTVSTEDLHVIGYSQ